MEVATASAPVALDGGRTMADNNLMNERDGESLYQICLKLRKRLEEVPNFRPYIDEMEEQEADGRTDPVSSLWRCFRAGKPLLAIFNASNPEDGYLKVDTSKVRENQVGKAATFKFLQACMSQMSIPAADTFLITDLYSDNTTGFVKVTKTVNRVLDILERSGKLYRSPETAMTQNQLQPVKLTRRQHILKELVDSERNYVNHLLKLQAFKKELEETGALTGDAIHAIFLNLNNLLDFAQRFLIRMEQHYELGEDQQDWGDLFLRYAEPFKQYEPFIANQTRCQQTCVKEWDKMKAAARSPTMNAMLETPMVLNTFLVKPFQRLSKYPLLLSDLRSHTEYDSEREGLLENLDGAIAEIQAVLQTSNASVDKENRIAAVEDLKSRVEDWKSLRTDQFGELMLFGTFIVLKGDGGKEQEREYHIYFFQRILLCCKDVNPAKQKSKYLPSGKEKQVSGKPRLQLKGRIFMANVTDIISSQRPGNHTIQIFWKGDPGVENFVIKFKTEDVMQKWNAEMEKQKAIRSETTRSRQMGTSDSQFTSLQGAQIQNPYQDFDADDDETLYERDVQHRSEWSMSRNASSNSLKNASSTASIRSRSTTGGSGSSVNTARAPPPRFPMETPPLTVQTQFAPGVNSPSDHPGNSYFSPIEPNGLPTPTSSRTSSQSQYNYRYGTPVNGMPEENNRYTAPAMSRNMSRDGTSGNPYIPNGRNTRPSLPPSSSSQPQIPVGMNRMRSASTPDIPNLPQTRRYANGAAGPPPDTVPVPPLPPHLVAEARAPPNRSQNNSPSNGITTRTGTASPGMPMMYKTPMPSGPTPLAAYDQIYRKQAAAMTTPMASAMDSEISPPPSAVPNGIERTMPSQLKAKVHYDDDYITLVIASNIQFRSLTDRIDAKLSRLSHHSIGSGSIKLKYRDEDGDYLSLDSSEALSDALLDWSETHAEQLAAGAVGEIDLYCSTTTGELVRSRG